MLNRLRRENPLPEGAVAVAVGLVISGVSTYGFLAIASRRLSAADYSTLGVFYTLLFAVGNGIMQPLEQEVARAVSARRARGLGPGPVIRRAVTIGLAFTAAVSVLALLTHQVVLDRWLGSSDTGLLFAFVLGLVAFCGAHLTRGVLSSHHRFSAYAMLFSADGVSRMALAAVLGAVGVAAVGAYGLLLAFTPFVGIAVGLARQRGLLAPGPEAPWSELTRALGWLLLGTVSLSLVIQGGTIAVSILATPQQEGAAGDFLNGLATARIPLFLFQAILASLLPKLSRLAHSGALDDFVSALRRLVVSILVLGGLTTVVAALVGPTFVDVVFKEAALNSRDLALLAGSFVLIMAAICIDQGLVALAAHSRMALGWGLSLAVFVVGIALGHDLFLRVELGLLAASIFAVGWMMVFLLIRLRHHARLRDVDMSEAVAELPAQP